MDLPREAQQAIEESFRPDRFRGVKGPLPPTGDWEKNLARIDPRLALRWHPDLGRYFVWMKMAASGLLWHQPVHIIETPSGEPRRPDSRDLFEIRRASWLSQHEGAQAWIDDLDKVAAIQRHQGEAARKVSREAWATRVAKKYDLRWDDLGIVKGAIYSGVPARKRHSLV